MTTALRPDDGLCQPGFPSLPVEEYATRLQRLQETLRDAGLCGVLLCNAANVAYYSGFRTSIRAPNLAWAMLIIPASGEPHAVVSNALANLFRESSWLAKVHAFGGSRYWNLPADPVALAGDIVRNTCGAKGQLGLERSLGMRVELTIEEIERLKHVVAGYELVDAAPLIWQQRVIKTAWEQTLYRRLGHITAAGFLSGLAVAREGVSEREIQRTMWGTFLASGADDSPVGGQLMIRSGRERNLTYCGRATDRRLERGDQLMLAGGPGLQGYHIDIHRFACIGPAPELQRALFNQSEAGLAAGIATTRPGTTTQAVFEAARTAMVREGMNSGVPWHVFGHGLGLDNYEPPMIRAEEPIEIVEGMVLTLEVPAYDIPQARVMGAFQEESVLVTANGCEVLTAGVPRDLWIVD